MALEDLKTLKIAIEEMDKFMSGAKSEHISTPNEFGKCIVKVMKELHLRIEELEREIGKSSAFIDPNDAPHRLR